MRIAIIGAGWVGTKLAEYLAEKKHHVIATTTTPDKIKQLQALGAEAHLLDFSQNPDFSVLENVDMAIFSMPIARNDWFDGFKKMDVQFPKTLLFSSTGIYPKESVTFTEEDKVNLRSDIVAAETLVTNQYPQTNILRFGGLMGGDRSLKKMFRNREPENPQKAANYIHYEDILAVVELFINSEIKGRIYNIVAPEHPTIGEILETAVPQNNGYSGQRIISSQRLIDDFNYTFKHPNPKKF